MRVAIYARVSKADKDDPNSIPVQLADCRDRAADEGWQVVGEFVDEGVSAWNPRRKRPEYGRLVEAVEAGTVDTILVREQERLLRQMSDAAKLADLAEAGKLNRIACTMEGDLILSRARDRKDFRDRASSAQFYSDFLGEKIRRTHARKRENGEWKGGGSRPFGLRIVGPKPYRVELDTAEAGLLRKAAADVLGGRTLRGIAAEWNGAGVLTSTGRRWTGARLGQVLRSGHIAGVREDGSPAGVPAIVDVETWRAVRDLLDDPERTRFAAPRIRRHFLVGITRCGRCDTRLTAHPNYHGARTYICRRGYDGTGCGRMRILADPFEEFVAAKLYLRWEDEQSRRLHAAATVDPAARDELRDLEGRLAELAEDYYRHRTISRDEYLRAKRGLDDDVARLRSQVATEVRESAGDWSALLEEAPATWPEVVADSGLVEWYNDLARRYVEAVIVDPAPRPGPGVPPAERVTIRWR